MSTQTMIDRIRKLFGKWSMPKEAVKVADSTYWVPTHKVIYGTVYNWQQLERNWLGIWQESNCWSTGFGRSSVRKVVDTQPK